MIDVTDAMVLALVSHFEQPLQTALSQHPSPGDLVDEVVSGWRSPVEDLVLPVIQVDAPIAGDREGRWPTVVSSQRVDSNGVPTALLTEPLFKYKLDLGSILIPLQVQVQAESQVDRSEIDAALEMSMLGNVDEGTGLVTVVSADYYNQTFSFRQAGAARRFDSANTVGREEWSSTREIEGAGCVMIEITAAGFTDLQAGLRVIEMGGDFNDVAAESFTVFNPTT